MKTVAFLSQKGGSGKTTLAVHIAVAAAESGEKVALVDTDTQRSATMWGETRGKNRTTPLLFPLSAHQLHGAKQTLIEDGYTLLLVDSAPHTAPDAVRIASQADLVVIPCRPTAFDIAAVTSTVDIVRAAAVRAVFVLSACPSRAPEIDETRSLLAPYGLRLFPGQISDRRSFARAVASGRAVTEFETHGKAADEIRALWVWLNKETKTHVRKES